LDIFEIFQDKKGEYLLSKISSVQTRLPPEDPNVETGRKGFYTFLNCNLSRDHTE